VEHEARLVSRDEAMRELDSGRIVW